MDMIVLLESCEDEGMVTAMSRSREIDYLTS